MEKKLLLILVIFLIFSGCIKTKDDLPQSDYIYEKLRDSDLKIEPKSQINQEINETQKTIVEKEIEKQKINKTEDSFGNITSIYKEETEQQSETSETQEEEIEEFLEWAEDHNIEIVGVNKTVNDFYYNGSKDGDFLDPKDVPNILEVADGLYKIPDDLLRVMDGKTIYISHQYGRGYSVLGSWPDQGILSGMNKGTIIEQTLTSEQAVHEFGHILDYHGIRGIYYDPKNLWKNLDVERNDVFKVDFEYNPNLVEPPRGYMDVYSTANDAENFAQHFMYYILAGNEFRESAESDELLKRKYDFFKEELFEGKEFR